MSTKKKAKRKKVVKKKKTKWKPIPKVWEHKYPIGTRVKYAGFPKGIFVVNALIDMGLIYSIKLTNWRKFVQPVLMDSLPVKWAERVKTIPFQIMVEEKDLKKMK